MVKRVEDLPFFSEYLRNSDHKKVVRNNIQRLLFLFILIYLFTIFTVSVVELSLTITV